MSQDLEIWLHNNPFSKKSEAKPHSDAILQQLLQNALNTTQSIEIFKNSNGKPYINAPLFFSHSNCRKLYAYITSNHHQVAIDVEYMNPHRDVMKLAKRYFHADEYAYLIGLSADKQHQVFYQWWTKKEAWCKLDGGNLWTYLNRSVLTNQPLFTQKGELIYMKNITGIKGFAGMVFSTAEINQLWLNNIA